MKVENDLRQDFKQKLYGVSLKIYRSLPFSEWWIKKRLGHYGRRLLEICHLIPNIDFVSPAIMADQEIFLREDNEFVIGIGLIEHLGDIIACEPIPRFLRERYPNARIVWVTRKEYSEILEANPYIDNVEIVVCLTDWIRLLRHNTFQIVVDLHVNGRICQDCRLALEKQHGNPNITGFNYFNYGSLLTAFSLGANLPPINESPKLFIPEEVSLSVNKLTLPEKFIVIHRKSNIVNGNSKDWDDKKWRTLLERFIHDYKDIYVIEVGSEDHKIDFMDIPHFVNMCGKLSILESAEVIRRAILFVGVDSGPAHMANAVKTKGVILLGHLPSFSNYMPFSGYYASDGATIVRSTFGPAHNITTHQVTMAVREILKTSLHEKDKSEELVNDTSIVTAEMENSPIDLNEIEKCKLIAFYLPQFHPIHDNDKAWGIGFTEWRNVASAKPWFRGHYQPRIPSDLGFYDLRVPEIMVEQAKLAKQYGIYGFCYYYYWFNGKRPLSFPIDNMLRNKDVAIPFCFCWANESWTKRWDGGNREIIIAQEHYDKDDLDFIQSVLPAFEDDRYIKINGKPLLLIYRTELFPNMAKTSEVWREKAREQGWPDLYLVRCEGFDINTKPEDINFNAAYEVPTFILPNSLLASNMERLSIHPAFQGKIFDYENIVQYYLQRPKPEYRRFYDVMLAWDNTARHRRSATIFHNVTAELYKRWLSGAIYRTMLENAGEERLLFINAWNEWAEGSYLEPDLRYGRRFLDATLEAKESSNFIRSRLTNFSQF